MIIIMKHNRIFTSIPYQKLKQKNMIKIMIYDYYDEIIG